ncbi:MAG: hypothetical protein AAB906_00730, partial [Patescibacteria group bacterium]
MVKDNISEIQDILKRIKDILNQFNKKDNTGKNERISEIENLKNTQKDILIEMEKVVKEEKRLTESAET